MKERAKKGFVFLYSIVVILGIFKLIYDACAGHALKPQEAQKTKKPKPKKIAIRTILIVLLLFLAIFSAFKIFSYFYDGKISEGIIEERKSLRPMLKNVPKDQSIKRNSRK